MAKRYWKIYTGTFGRGWTIGQTNGNASLSLGNAEEISKHHYYKLKKYMKITQKW